MINKNNSPKILISIYGLVQGGGEIFPIRLANYLKKHGYDVQLHVLLEREEEIIVNMVDPHIKVFRCRSRIQFIKYIICEKIQVIHTHCNSNQLFVSGCMKWVPWLNVKHIATAHGGYEGMEYERARQQILQCDKYVSKWTYVADNNYETLERVGIPKEKCVKIKNAMERPEYIKSIDRERYGIPQDAKLVTVITRAVGKKCWPECIEAVTRARKESGLNIHLILCGIGEVYTELKRNGVPEYVHLLGAISNPCDFYAASDLGMLLSIRECAPLGIIEMYYAKTPVIATDTGDVREMMEVGTETTGVIMPLTKNGLVDVDLAADALNKMFTHTMYYQRCKELTGVKVKEYEFSHIAKMYVREYRL